MRLFGYSSRFSRLEEHPLGPRDSQLNRVRARDESSIPNVWIDRRTGHRPRRGAEDHVVAPRVRIDKWVRPRAIVPELDEPERSRVANDRAADLFAYLANQGVKDRLGTLPAPAGQHMGSVLIENEDRAARSGEDRARGDDEPERRLLVR